MLAGIFESTREFILGDITGKNSPLGGEQTEFLQQSLFLGGQF